MLEWHQHEPRRAAAADSSRPAPEPPSSAASVPPRLSPTARPLDHLGVVLARTIRGRAIGPLLQRFRKYEDGAKVTIGSNEYMVLKLLRPDAKEEPYLVKDANDRQWVIKWFKPERKQVYAKEKDMMSMVQGSPNVVALHGFDDAQQLLLMEYVEFGSAAETLDKRKEWLASWSNETRRSLVKNIIVGLKHLHARGVVHNDLDAKNIFIGGTAEAPTAKIADFGDNSKVTDLPAEDRSSGPSAAKAFDYWAALSPIVRILTNNKITRAQTLSDDPSSVEKSGCPADAQGFLNAARDFATAWQHKRPNGNTPDPDDLLVLAARITEHSWLA